MYLKFCKTYQKPKQYFAKIKIAHTDIKDTKVFFSIIAMKADLYFDYIAPGIFVV